MPSASTSATNRNFVIATTGLTQAGGATTIDISSIQNSALQIAFETTGATTAGTLGITYRPRGATTYRTLLDQNGTTVSVALTTCQAITIPAANIDSIKVTPTAFDGTTYSVLVSGL